MKAALSPSGKAEIILRPGKIKTILYLLICLGFTFPILVIGPGPKEKPIWIVASLFGLGALVFVLQLIPGTSYLRLTQEGFTCRSSFRIWPPILWHEVSGFRVVSLGRGGKMVVYNSTRTSRPTLRRVNIALVGASEGSPDTYGLKAEELAEVLNTWRDRNKIEE